MSDKRHRTVAWELVEFDSHAELRVQTKAGRLMYLLDVAVAERFKKLVADGWLMNIQGRQYPVMVKSIPLASLGNREKRFPKERIGSDLVFDYRKGAGMTDTNLVSALRNLAEVKGGTNIDDIGWAMMKSLIPACNGNGNVPLEDGCEVMTVKVGVKS